MVSEGCWPLRRGLETRVRFSASLRGYVQNNWWYASFILKTRVLVLGEEGMEGITEWKGMTELKGVLNMVY